MVHRRGAEDAEGSQRLSFLLCGEFRKAKRSRSWARNCQLLRGVAQLENSAPGLHKAEAIYRLPRLGGKR
jgi:hypothetical protein